MADKLAAPFPYFGGKARVAPIVWRALGPDVPRYIEPFAGSLAVLLARPVIRKSPPYEIVNDADGLVVNFWRAIRSDPDAVVDSMDWMPSEVDLRARMRVLRTLDLVDQLTDDPRWCDPEIAGWWAWAMSARILPSYNGTDSLDLRSSLGVTSAGRRDRLRQISAALARRLRSVRVYCGSWERPVAESVTGVARTTAIFLDPPYDNAVRGGGLYNRDNGDVAADVRAWCIENGHRTNLRIVLAGYAAEHDDDIPDTWRRVQWETDGVFGAEASMGNRSNEMLWVSPTCRA